MHSIPLGRLGGGGYDIAAACSTPSFSNFWSLCVDQSQVLHVTLLHSAGWRWRMSFRGNDARPPWHPSHHILHVSWWYWLVLPPSWLPVKMKHVNTPSENFLQLVLSHFLFSCNTRIAYALPRSVWFMGFNRGVQLEAAGRALQVPDKTFAELAKAPVFLNRSLAFLTAEWLRMCP
jgi:hypothetical protein